jgi:hypothetical protein
VFSMIGREAGENGRRGGSGRALLAHHGRDATLTATHILSAISSDFLAAHNFVGRLKTHLHLAVKINRKSPCQCETFQWLAQLADSKCLNSHH